MINWILKKFGLVAIPLSAEIKNTDGKDKEERWRQEILVLERKVESLQKLLSFLRPKVPMDLGNSEPIDREARKAYVAEVAGFHKDILGKKIISMIADVRERLGKLDSRVREDGSYEVGYSAREFDLLLKGTENALWLVYDWGEGSINEFLSYQEGATEEELKEAKELLK